MKKSVVLVLAGLMFNVAAFAAVGQDKAPVDCSKIVKELKEKQAAKKANAQQPSDGNGTVHDAQ